MQKWCPEPFDVTVPASRSIPGPAAGFEPSPESGAEPQALFRSETGFVDQRTLMASLTQSERSQLFELVELEVADAYLARENTLKADHESALADARNAYESELAGLGEAVENTMAVLRKDMAAACARLAVQLAGKVVRDTVKVDPGVLTRNLETTLFKIQGSGPVTVAVHPDDARRLAEHPEILERLQISAVSRDRRVEQGGGLVYADERTWDATLTSQLEALGEVVEEMIATAVVDPAPAPSAGEPA